VEEINVSYFKNAYRGRYILINLVKQDLKNRYRNSVLGMAWTFLTPLGLVLVIGSVYSVVFGLAMKDFIPFLFSGIIPWLYLSNCAEAGTGAYINAQGYIKQTQAPIEIFPARVALGAFVNLLFSLIAYFAIYLIISPQKFSLNMFMAIPALIIWLIIGIGWSSIVSIVNLYLRDFQPLQSLGLQALFYVTPIIYQPDSLRAKHYAWVFLSNPIYYLLEILRSPLLGNAIPPIKYWLISLAIMLVVVFTAITVSKKVGRKIAFKL
jgi:ABC-type polysaccharide/polyol phosphate export permease